MESRHETQPLRVIATFLFFLTVATQTTSNAQTVPDPCAEVAEYKDFITLADRRAELLAESQQLTFDISALENELLDAGTQAEVDALKKRLDDLQNKPNKTEFDEQSIQTYETLIRKTGIDTEISAKLAEKNEVLAKDKVLLQCIQSKISQLTSPEQNFRTNTSWVFAALIGAVIIGFFVLAFRDEVMRRAIFSGETGIQFLTLFSVVIAIILFGCLSGNPAIQPSLR